MFDSENLTLHATSPGIPDAVVLPQRRLTSGCDIMKRGINHDRSHFTQNKRYRDETCARAPQ